MMRFGARNVMNAELAIGNHLQELVNPNFAGVVNFECAGRAEPAIQHCEHGRFKEVLVLGVKRTVDEDTPVVPT
jgi:hypothetical protein